MRHPWNFMHHPWYFSWSKQLLVEVSSCWFICLAILASHVKRIFSMSHIFGKKRQKPSNFLAYHSKPVFEISSFVAGNHTREGLRIQIYMTNGSSKTKFVLLLNIALSGKVGIKFDQWVQSITIHEHHAIVVYTYIIWLLTVIYLFSKCFPGQ